MGLISKKPINEFEVLKELRSKFKRDRRGFEKMNSERAKEISTKYEEYIAALDTAIYCVGAFPFINFREIDKKYKLSRGILIKKKASKKNSQ